MHSNPLGRHREELPARATAPLPTNAMIINGSFVSYGNPTRKCGTAYEINFNSLALGSVYASLVDDLSATAWESLGLFEYGRIMTSCARGLEIDLSIHTCAGWEVGEVGR